MSKKQRDKGKKGEREVVNLLKSCFVPARRISMNETNHEDKGDVLVADVWKAQVKYGELVPIFIYSCLENGEDMAFVRKVSKDSRGYEWLVVMKAKDFIDKFL